MAKNPGHKIVDGLSTLLHGFSDLEDVLETDFGGDSEDAEYASALVSELMNSIESLIETEDYTPKYIASVVKALTSALEEIDPDLFSKEKEEEEAEVDSDDDDDDEVEDLDEYLDEDDS